MVGLIGDTLAKVEALSLYCKKFQFLDLPRPGQESAEGSSVHLII